MNQRNEAGRTEYTVIILVFTQLIALGSVVAILTSPWPTSTK